MAQKLYLVFLWLYPLFRFALFQANIQCNNRLLTIIMSILSIGTPFALHSFSLSLFSILKYSLIGEKMLLYQIKIQVKPFKPDEFMDSMSSFIRTFRKEKGCVDFGVYHDSEMSDTYILVGEWKTRQAMKKHFKSHNFELLIGAARVLGKKFSMNIAEVSKTGGIDLAREQFAS
jgi:quinol monooxygenase YgiN